MLKEVWFVQARQSAGNPLPARLSVDELTSEVCLLPGPLMTSCRVDNSAAIRKNREHRDNNPAPPSGARGESYANQAIAS